ncbi:hypothetical protein KY289_031422 [Solanum tuberosum]|nr:hypothetical protein KY289_031422 [Solanum tuberosum]
MRKVLHQMLVIKTAIQPSRPLLKNIVAPTQRRAFLLYPIRENQMKLIPDAVHDKVCGEMVLWPIQFFFRTEESQTEN